MAESNFVDYVKIYCRSGKGGRGSSHVPNIFRKVVPTEVTGEEEAIFIFEETGITGHCFT